MADASLVGVDLGTTSVKAILMRQDGHAVAASQASYGTQRGPGGHVTQDTDDWVRLTRAAIEKLGDGAGPVAAMAMCSQVNTHVFVGPDGQALTPAMTWQDTRAAAEATELDARLSDDEKIALLGAPMPIDASHALPRMLWMSRHRPDVWQATRWVMLPKDYVLFHLTGEVISDPLSNVGLTGPDLRYAEPLFDLVPGALEKMAPLVDVISQVGVLRDGPLKEVPVINGTMDAWAGLIGAGGGVEGGSVYLSGTSEILGISSKSVNPTPGAIVFPQAAGLRLHAAPTQHGGDAVQWASEVLRLSFDDMERRITAERASQTPLFLPQLEGERAPLWGPEYRGAFLGLGRNTTNADLIRAVYEGVAMQALWAFETLQASSGVDSEVITCGGGGFQSAAWAQIRADVFGKPFKSIGVAQPGALGAVMIAGLGTGLYASMAEAQRHLVSFDKTYTPDPQKTALYRGLSGLYREAVAANLDLHQRLTRLNG